MADSKGGESKSYSACVKPTALTSALRKASECGDKEGWFTVDLLAPVREGELVPDEVTWVVSLLGPTAYTVNPLGVTRARASPYRRGVFEAHCTFATESYPFGTPSITFVHPVFHPHVHKNGEVDSELMAVLWKNVASSFATRTPPVLLAHLLLELLAYPTVPEPVVSRTAPAPADAEGSAFHVLVTAGVDGFEAQARQCVHLAREQRRGRPGVHTAPHEPGSDNDDDTEVLAVGTIVQAVGLWQIVLQGHVHDVSRLIDAGVDPNLCTGVPPRPLLSWAARSRASVAHQIAIMQILVRAGAHVNQPSPFGRTPLMEAAKAGCEEAVHLLLAAGANVELVDKTGSTAYDIALAAGNDDIALLVKPGDRTPDPRLELRRRLSTSSGASSDAGDVARTVQLVESLTPRTIVLAAAGKKQSRRDDEYLYSPRPRFMRREREDGRGRARFIAQEREAVPGDAVGAGGGRRMRGLGEVNGAGGGAGAGAGAGTSAGVESHPRALHRRLSEAELATMWRARDGSYGPHIGEHAGMKLRGSPNSDVSATSNRAARSRLLPLGDTGGGLFQLGMDATCSDDVAHLRPRALPTRRKESGDSVPIAKL